MPKIEKQKHVKVGPLILGNDRPLILIAGPDSLESEERALFFARELKKICGRLKIGYIFKASYDKANRTSYGTFRGVGLDKGLAILAAVRKKVGVPVTTDVHSVEEAEKAAQVVDLVQVPALLSRQTDIVLAAAKHAKAVNIKKGQFMSPYDVEGVLSKIKAAKQKNVLITERGYTFGYQNLVVDMRSLEIIKSTGYPVIFDASHSVQLPSAGRGVSAGEREFIFPLARAAVAVGIAGLFLEVYDNPKKAPVDGPNAFLLKDVPAMLQVLKKIDTIIKNELRTMFVPIAGRVIGHLVATSKIAPGSPET